MGSSLTILAVEDDQILHIDQCRTGKQAWLALKILYKESSTANKMRLYEKFLTLKLTKSKGARAHIQECSSVRNELRSVGLNIDNNLYKLAILQSLSTRFEILVVALEANIESITIEDLHSRIFREDMRQEDVDNEGAGHALESPSGKAFDTVKRFSKNNVTFHYCKRKGHIKARCFKKERDETSQTGGPSVKHNIAFTFSTESNTSYLYIDSGSSYHICHNENLFDDSLVTMQTPIMVQIGDGRKIFASQKGNISANIKTSYGNYSAVIRNVFYMPDSKVNLVSVAQIQEKGFAFYLSRITVTCMT